LVAARCRPSRQWLLAYLQRVATIMQQQQQQQQHQAPLDLDPQAPTSRPLGAAPAQQVSSHGSVQSTHALSVGDVSAVTSALLKCDRELGRLWLQRLRTRYG